ncbi:MAG: hypothetical protein KDA25_11135 [Phycisphaerales bacterium]|nr:hypothetical protein [Phycisphaerales bacterium]
MALPSGPLAQKIGFALSRIIVPLWVFSGAGMKLYYKTPRNLPKGLFDLFVKDLGASPGPLLATIIGLEFFAIAVMLFIGRLARPMAIFMLSCFLLVLANEMRLGQFESCGCFGDIKVDPWITLGIDLALLVGVVFFRPSRPAPDARAPLALPAAIVCTVFGFVASFGLMWNYSKAIDRPTDPGTDLVDDGTEPPVDPTPDGGTPDDGSPVRIVDDGTPKPGGTTPDGAGATQPPAKTARPGFVARTPDPLKGFYFAETDTWIGTRWDDLTLARLLNEWPADINTGRYYVIFFSHTCDHCHEYLEYWFLDNPTPTLLVAIPENKTGFAPRNQWLTMPCRTCPIVDLPVGCDYIVTTPIVLALEDGVITCAKEGDDPEAPECLIFE